MEDNMQTKYEKKVIEPYTVKKKTPTKDGEIFRDGNVWKFKWKGGECGYRSESDAKKGLAKVSGTSEEQD